MKSFFLLLFMSFTSLNYAGANELSYGALAQKRISMAWEKAAVEFETLEENFLPHETKTLRKLIGSLREQVDLFVYAYPKGDPDMWENSRDDLDKLYEKMGAFKDLYDVQNVSDPTAAVYDDDQVKKLRKKLLESYDAWLLREEAYKSYLDSPSLDELHDRPTQKLSKFYWGATDLKPTLDLSGEANLAALSVDLIEKATLDWNELKDNESPALSVEVEVKFHDFRKRLRSILRIIRTTPNIYTGEDSVLVSLEALVEEYGSVNDKLVAYHKAVEEDKRRKARRLKDEINEEWDDLVQKQLEMELPTLLSDLFDNIRKL